MLVLSTASTATLSNLPRSRRATKSEKLSSMKVSPIGDRARDKMLQLFPKFQRMPGLSGSICILLVLTWPVRGASVFTEDGLSVNSSFEANPLSCPIAATQWSTAFQQLGAIPLVKGKLLSTIPALGKQWRVSFEVFPENFNHQGLASVLHLMNGEKGTKFGKRIPAVWIHRNKRILVSTTLGKKLIFNKRFRSSVLKIRKWTKIEISQMRQGGNYIYSIKMGGRQAFTANNSRPREIYDVKVYAASPSSPPLAGSIRNLKIEVGVERPSSVEEGISLKTSSKEFCKFSNNSQGRQDIFTVLYSTIVVWILMV